MPFDEVYIQQELERIIEHHRSECAKYLYPSGSDTPCECYAERQRAEVLALIRSINQDKPGFDESGLRRS